MMNHETRERHEKLPPEDSVLGIARQLHDLQQGAVRQTLACCSSEVDAMVRLNVTDQHRIERTLDQLLDVAFDERVLVLFKKLCRHYYAINPEATTYYVHSYREMWDDLLEKDGE